MKWIRQEIRRATCHALADFMLGGRIRFGPNCNNCNGDMLVWRWRAEGPISPLQSQPTETSYRNDRFQSHPECSIFLACIAKWHLTHWDRDVVVDRYLQRIGINRCQTRLRRVTGPFCGEFPAQRPVTRSFNVFLDLRLNKRLSKQWWGWWFETPSGPLWHHCNVER